MDIYLLSTLLSTEKAITSITGCRILFAKFCGNEIWGKIQEKTETSITEITVHFLNVLKKDKIKRSELNKTKFILRHLHRFILKTLHLICESAKT